MSDFNALNITLGNKSITKHNFGFWVINKNTYTMDPVLTIIYLYDYKRMGCLRTKTELIPDSRV